MADDEYKADDEVKHKIKDEVEKETENEAKVTVDVKTNEAKFQNAIESEVDTRKRVCHNCNEMQQLVNDTLNESQNNIQKLETRIRLLTDQKKNAEERYIQVKQRSDEITACMADVFNNKADLENVNDKFSNTKVARRLESMYSTKWCSLTEWFLGNIGEIDELSLIKNLTSLMKKIYETCTSLSDNGIRAFLALEGDEPLPSAQEDPLLYKVKRGYGLTTKRRNAIKKSVMEILLMEDNFNALLDKVQGPIFGEGKAKLEDFLNEFTEICWLIAISNPKIILNFDVNGELYEGSIRDRFRQYACQDAVIDMSKMTHTIIEVVWPSVEIKDGSGIHTKGDVIVVEKGKEETNEKKKTREKQAVGDITSEVGVAKDRKNRDGTCKKADSENGKKGERMCEVGAGEESANVNEANEKKDGKDSEIGKKTCESGETQESGNREGAFKKIDNGENKNGKETFEKVGSDEQWSCEGKANEAGKHEKELCEKSNKEMEMDKIKTNRKQEKEVKEKNKIV